MPAIPPQDTRSPVRQLPFVLAVTVGVCVLPALAAQRLVPTDGVRSIIASVVLTLALSAGAAQLGAAAWARRPQADDTLFADLLIGRWLGVQWRKRRLRRMRARLLVLPPSPKPGRLAALARVGLLLEARDRNVYGHSRRVARYTQRIAEALHLPADEVETIHQAALVHDIGKIYTPREILDKPGRLTDAEFDVIKRHAAEGAGLLEASAGPEIRAIVRHHHERLDGKGYPDGLAGGDVPLGARIIAVADTFDALTSTRPYRPAATHRQALEVLRKEAGSQLDADVVAAFLRVYSGRRPVALTAALGTVGGRLFDRAASGLSQAGAVLQAVPAIGAAIALAGTPALHSADRTQRDATPSARAQRASAPDSDRTAPARRVVLTTPARRPATRPAARKPGRRGSRTTTSTRTPRRSSAPAPAPTQAAAVAAQSSPAAPAPAPAGAPPHVTTPPPVSTPQVTTPAVSTPALSTPVATIPAIPLPTVAVPAVTLPPFVVPAVSVGPVALQ